MHCKPARRAVKHTLLANTINRYRGTDTNMSYYDEDYYPAPYALVDGDRGEVLAVIDWEIFKYDSLDVKDSIYYLIDSAGGRE